MILYTTMPQELVFQTFNEEYDKRMFIEYDGIPMLVEKNEENDFRVVQIMSSDPQHFLDNRYCPGTILSNMLSSNK